jgi:hypothetical protein
MAATNGTLTKVVVGALSALAVAGILGAIAMAQTVTQHGADIQHVQRRVTELREDTIRRLDRLEQMNQEILRELRK